MLTVEWLLQLLYCTSPQNIFHFRQIFLILFCKYLVHILEWVSFRNASVKNCFQWGAVSSSSSRQLREENETSFESLNGSIKHGPVFFHRQWINSLHGSAFWAPEARWGCLCGWDEPECWAYQKSCLQQTAEIGQQMFDEARSHRTIKMWVVCTVNRKPGAEF